MTITQFRFDIESIFDEALSIDHHNFTLLRSMEGREFGLKRKLLTNKSASLNGRRSNRNSAGANREYIGYFHESASTTHPRPSASTASVASTTKYRRLSNIEVHPESSRFNLAINAVSRFYGIFDTIS